MLWFMILDIEDHTKHYLFQAADQKAAEAYTTEGQWQKSNHWLFCLGSVLYQQAGKPGTVASGEQRHVCIEDVGPNSIQMIKLVRTYWGEPGNLPTVVLGLKEAKQFIDNIRAGGHDRVMSTRSHEQALECAKFMKATGANVWVAQG